jgi:glycine/D-amino acid oxidase-like deaminating enzyme
LRAAAGAILTPNGAFWPYRLITAIWSQLRSLYPTRLAIETSTPVTKISYDATISITHPYSLDTPRGRVRAKKVIHATNGYTGHLLPELRGKIYPVRGTMSTQKSTSEFGQHGDTRSWSMYKSSCFDKETATFEAGLYYGAQNPRTGDIFFGGERANIYEMLNGDDTQIGIPCRNNLSDVLPRFFINGWRAGSKPEVIKMWSGIMGFTADRLPLVGPLPESVTKRGPEGGEYVAAGFNGYGMPLCWSSGEAVAKMILGIDVSDFLPVAFHPDKARLLGENRMTTSLAVQALFGGHA